MWFPDKNDPELERLAAIIWDLRRSEFSREVYERSQEGVWETEEQEKARDRRNEEAIMKFDCETLRLIKGA